MMANTMSDAKATAALLTEIELSVPGMVCDGCAEKVRNTLTALSGVRDAKPNAWRRRIAVRYEPAMVEATQLMAALRAVGFEAAEA